LIDIYLPKIGHYLEIQVRNAEESSMPRQKRLCQKFELHPKS